jgi:hypothetical protein
VEVLIQCAMPAKYYGTMQLRITTIIRALSVMVVHFVITLVLAKLNVRHLFLPIFNLRPAQELLPLQRLEQIRALKRRKGITL